MTESNDEVTESVGRGRVPGKYIVIGLVVFGLLFFGVTLILSIGLTPAAQRFHNPAAATPH